MPRRILYIAAFVVPCHLALANAGTPLMWATALHLVVGNLFVALLESCALRFWFGVSWKRAIPLLLLANYGSAWLGATLLDLVPADAWGLTIETLPMWLAGFVLAAFLLSLIVELPAFWTTFESNERSFSRALRATLAIHGLSYLLLGAYYWSASGTTMLTRLRVVPAESLAAPADYLVYFLAPDGRSVWRCNLGGGESGQLVRLPENLRADRLVARARPSGGYDLCALVAPSDHGSATELTVVVSSFSSLAAVQRKPGDSLEDAEPRPTGMNFGRAPSIATSPTVEVGTGFWPIDGVSGHEPGGNWRFRYGLELPWIAWPCRNAVHMPGDFVLFQLGADQICLLDPRGERIALLARGYGPVLAMPAPALSSPQPKATP